MAISIDDIKKLRAMTGAGLADVKKALTEAEGDFDRAKELLRERGLAIAAKRSDRETSNGCVLTKVENGFAAIIALKCETDFVANGADFIALTKSILDAGFVVTVLGFSLSIRECEESLLYDCKYRFSDSLKLTERTVIAECCLKRFDLLDHSAVLFASADVSRTDHLHCYEWTELSQIFIYMFKEAFVADYGHLFAAVILVSLPMIKPPSYYWNFIV